MLAQEVKCENYARYEIVETYFISCICNSMVTLVYDRHSKKYNAYLISLNENIHPNDVNTIVNTKKPLAYEEAKKLFYRYHISHKRYGH